MTDKDDVCRDEQIGKDEDKLACISLNVNSLRKDIQKEKHDSLRNFLHQMNSYIVGLQEVNLYWDKLLSNEQWLERSKGWQKGGQYASIAYNKTDTITSVV